MNFGTIGALVSKDFNLFFKNRFFALITVIGLVFYVGIYFIMPKAVDESLDIGIYSPVAPAALEQLQGEGLEISFAESEDLLKEGVLDGQYLAGIVLSADLLAEIRSGEKSQVTVYLTADVPQEIKDIVAIIVEELGYRIAGQSLVINVTEEILGTDMAGMQIPPRDRMRPLLAVVLILFETFAMANLIAEEIERGTIRALLVTPLTVKDLFIAKGITGLTLALVPAVLFMVLVGGFNQQPLVILTALFLGSLLSTGFGFIIGALSKDFMSVLAWGIIIMITLLIPTFGVLFPGLSTGWVKFIPSFYLVDTVHTAANFGIGWSGNWLNLVILFGVDIVLFWIGIIALGRRYR